MDVKRLEYIAKRLVEKESSGTSTKTRSTTSPKPQQEVAQNTASPTTDVTSEKQAEYKKKISEILTTNPQIEQRLKEAIKSDGTVDYTRLGQKTIDEFKDASGSVDFTTLTKVAVDIAQKEGLIDA